MLLVTSAAVAQTKVSGTATCSKPDPMYRIDIGDRPGHAFMLTHSKCTWTKPLEVAGVTSKEGESTGFDEVSGNTTRFRGYYLDTAVNGDRADYRFVGSGIMKDGAFQSSRVKWTLVRGTGKYKGVKANGTCEGKGNADGSVTNECEGEYAPRK